MLVWTAYCCFVSSAEYATGIKQGPELYATAKALDPTRLVIDADGLFGWSPNNSE